jgi:hypothetical protein
MCTRKPCTSHPGYFCRSIRLHPFQPIRSYVRIAVASFSRTISTNIFPCFLRQARTSVTSLPPIPLPWMLGSTNKVLREANELIEVEAVMELMTVGSSADASRSCIWTAGLPSYSAMIECSALSGCSFFANVEGPSTGYPVRLCTSVSIWISIGTSDGWRGRSVMSSEQDIVFQEGLDLAVIVTKMMEDI